MKRPWNIPFTMDATNEDGSKSPTLIFPSIGMKMIGIRLLPKCFKSYVCPKLSAYGNLR